MSLFLDWLHLFIYLWSLEGQEFLLLPCWHVSGFWQQGGVWIISLVLTGCQEFYFYWSYQSSRRWWQRVPLWSKRVFRFCGLGSQGQVSSSKCILDPGEARKAALLVLGEEHKSIGKEWRHSCDTSWALCVYACVCARTHRWRGLSTRWTD